MKITILLYLEEEGIKAKDVVTDQIMAALREGGHEVSVFGVHGDLRKLINGLTRRKPALVFNMMEMFGTDQLGYVAVAGVLDLLGIPYTGGGPGEFYLQEDKALTKKLLAFEKVGYPDFAVFSRDADLETAGKLRLPLFVKPLRLDASNGIGAKSLVRSTREMMERVLDINNNIKDSALVEEYIEGRELYVGVVGNQNPTVFPPIEIDFSGMPEGMPHVMDAKAKWDTKSKEYKGTKVVLAELPDEMQAKVQKTALSAYRALRVRDYGRIDLRLGQDGEIYVIEVNASCYLEKTSEFATGAAAAGIDYTTLINRIAQEALERSQNNAPKRKSKTPAKKVAE